MIIFITEKKLKTLIKDALMTDTNIADALKSLSAKIDTVIANQATPVAPTVDFTPVTTAITASQTATVAAVQAIVDSIDTPTS